MNNKIKNPIPKEQRARIKELFALKDLLIQKGVLTDKEIKDEAKKVK